ncbi:Gldg family protein [Glaciecola sp. XM2]|uniref:GldG family protein n=1 Tax=Glaciecola sp. XM2 TaxID=1914931 RepID=UPI001BDEABC6|nr:GldG family protein [Glaciecola sp. XM2]MBT1452351.1 Gldg family protein [Glaciecola sp. XM2]
MKTTFSTFTTLLALAFSLLAIVFLSNQFLRSASLDLTQDKLYSVSDGTKAILEALDEPIDLYFFFSDETSKGMAQLRNYAMEVESLLTKYAELGGDNIRLTVIDPQPFSEQEDKAASFGLSAVNIGPAQDSLYFGLVGENTAGDAMIIGFFDPNKAAFLEYDISKLVYQLSSPEPVRVSIVTDLPLMGEQNPMTSQTTPANVIYQQLSQLFEVNLVSNSEPNLPEQTDVLIIAHPQGLSETLLYDIDQFIMNGGRSVVFYDPHFESDTMAMLGAQGANTSSLPLLDAYGIDVLTDNVVLDAQAGLEIRGPQGNVIQHLGFLGLAQEQINRIDVTSGDLESMNGASFGQVTIKQDTLLSLSPLLQSTENTSVIDTNEYALTQDPSILSQAFVNSGEVKTLAGRISGTVESYFGLEHELVGEGHLSQTSSLNMVVVADVDVFIDRFWVQQSNFFGQPVFTPFANNGDFVINMVENYGGSENLIGLRSRGTLSRPFTRVDDIALEAQAKFREQENRLQSELQETEMQLAQLQGQQDDALTLSDEQQQAIDAFVDKRIEIRKALRDVQFQLDKDINALGTKLKLLNIVVAPVLLTLLLFLLTRLVIRR